MAGALIFTERVAMGNSCGYTFAIITFKRVSLSRM